LFHIYSIATFVILLIFGALSFWMPLASQKISPRRYPTRRENDGQRLRANASRAPLTGSRYK
jgi:hypothetical protein